MLNIVRYLKTSSSNNNNKTPHTKGGLVDEEAKQLELSDAAGGGIKGNHCPGRQLGTSINAHLAGDSARLLLGAYPRETKT